MLKVKSIGWYLYTKNSVIFVYFLKKNSIFFHFFFGRKIGCRRIEGKIPIGATRLRHVSRSRCGYCSADLKFFLTLARAMHAPTVKKNSNFRADAMLASAILSWTSVWTSGHFRLRACPFCWPPPSPGLALCCWTPFLAPNPPQPE